MACFARLRHATPTMGFVAAKKSSIQRDQAAVGVGVTREGTRQLHHRHITIRLPSGSAQLCLQGAPYHTSCVTAPQGGLRVCWHWSAPLHTQVVVAAPAKPKPGGSGTSSGEHGSVLTQLTSRPKEPKQVTVAGKGASMVNVGCGISDER